MNFGARAAAGILLMLTATHCGASSAYRPSAAGAPNATTDTAAPNTAVLMVLPGNAIATTTARRQPQYLYPTTATIVFSAGGIPTSFNVATGNTVAYGTPGFTATPARPCIYINDGASNNTTRACTLFLSLAAGPAHIVVEAFDSTSHVLSAGSTDVTIVTATTNYVALTLSPVLSSVAVSVTFSASSTVASAQNSTCTGLSIQCIGFNPYATPPIPMGVIAVVVDGPNGAIPITKPVVPATTPETMTANTDPFITAGSVPSVYAVSGTVSTTAFSLGLSSATGNIVPYSTSTCTLGVPITSGLFNFQFTNAAAVPQRPQATLCFEGAGYAYTGGSPPYDELSSSGAPNASETVFAPLVVANNGDTIYVGQAFQSAQNLTAALGTSSSTGGGSTPDGTCSSETRLNVGSTTVGPGQSITAVANSSGTATFIMTPPNSGNSCTIRYSFAGEALIVSRAYTGASGGFTVH